MSVVIALKEICRLLSPREISKYFLPEIISNSQSEDYLKRFDEGSKPLVNQSAQIPNFEGRPDGLPFFFIY